MKNNNDNKFKEGEIVFSKENPNVKLLVDRYLDRIYFCKYVNDPTKKQLPLFERELVGGEYPPK